MHVQFVLTMDDAVVYGTLYDHIIIRWVSELDQDEIMDISHQWITTKNFLTHWMVGLTQIGESSLTIEPLDEEIKEFRI